jgi:hypothetical protein
LTYIGVDHNHAGNDARYISEIDRRSSWVFVRLGICFVLGNRAFVAAGESVVMINIDRALSVVCEFAAHSCPIVGICVVRSNLIPPSADRTIKVFDPMSFGLLHKLNVHNDIAAFDALPDTTAIAIALAEGSWR